VSSQPGGPLPGDQEPPRKPRKTANNKRHTFTPFALFGLVADAAAVLGVIIGRFNLVVSIGALLGVVIGTSVLIRRRKARLDRTSWLAIIGLVVGAVVLTTMVPQLRAEVGGQPTAASGTSTPGTSAPAPTSASASTSVSSSAASTSETLEPSTGQSTAPKLLYADSPTLKLSQGVDFEKNGAISSGISGPSGGIDLFLTNPYGVLTLYPNALNNKLVANTSSQVETAEHCAIVLKQGQPVSYTYVIESLSYCFLTSDGHVGLLTVSRALPDAALVRVLVWDAKLN